MTFAAPIKVVIRLIVWDVNEETGVQSIRDVKEQEVYFGEIPLMTETGTFIINGTERVVVSPAAPLARRLLRSRQGQDALVGKLLYSRARHPVPRLVARLRVRPQGHHLRPHRPPPQAARDGAAARARLLDRGAAQLLLRHRDDLPRAGRRSTRRQVDYELLAGQRATRDIKHPKTKEVLVKKNRKFTKAAIRKLQESRHRSPADRRRRARRQGRRRTTSSTTTTGEVLLECNEELTEAKLDELRERGVEQLQGPLHRRPQRRPVPPRHAARRQAPGPRRGDHGDLPPPPPGRSADARDGADAVPQPVLQRRALRPVAGSAASS